MDVVIKTKIRIFMQQQTPPGVPGPARDAPRDDPQQGQFAGFMATYGAGKAVCSHDSETEINV